MFNLVTLTLKFDLLLKNFNLGHYFLTRSDRAFILYRNFLRRDIDLEVLPTFEKTLTFAAI